MNTIVFIIFWHIWEKAKKLEKSMKEKGFLDPIHTEKPLLLIPSLHRNVPTVWGSLPMQVGQQKRQSSKTHEGPCMHTEKEEGKKLYKSVLCIEKRQKLFLNFRNTCKGLFVNMLLKAKLNDLNNYAVVSWHQSQVKKIIEQLIESSVNEELKTMNIVHP